MLWKYLKERVENLLWHPQLPSGSSALRRAVRVLRFPYAVLRDTIEGQLTLRAMSLVYTTLLSLVPLLAFSFSVLKGFGVHQQVRPLLEAFLQPLGEKGDLLTDNIITFVDQMRVDVLGAVGLAFLVYTVISLIQKVEDAFNYVWQVEQPRSIAKRFSEYLSLLLIGPVVIFMAIGTIAAFHSNTLIQRLSLIEPLGMSMIYAGKLMPFVLVTLLFSFVYAFVPNTRVRVSAALLGGVVAGLLWTLSGLVFAAFVAASTRYTAIYSGFAVVIFALIWLYINWLILFLGAQISFYYQNPVLLRSGRSRLELSNRLREQVALLIMYLVAERFRHKPPSWTAGALGTRIGIPARALGSLLGRLENAGLLVRSEDDLLLPARDPANIRLSEILTIARAESGDGPSARSIAPVDAALQASEEASREALANRSLADLIVDSIESVTENAAPDPALRREEG